MAALLASFAVHPALAGGLVLVMNAGSASISVLDMDTEKEMRRIPVLREPHHWALKPDGRSLLVGDTGASELWLLDPLTGALKRRVPAADPYQVGFSPDGRFLVVTGLARNQVDVYDAELRLLKRFPLATMPSHLAFAPDGRRVFVTLQGTDRLAAIDLETMAVIWNQPVGKTPAGVLWHRDKLLVANMGEDTVAVVDPADGGVIRRIHTGKGAHQIFPSPDGKLVWVNNRVAGTTVALDAATLAPERSYDIPGGPDDIAFAPDGRVWITRRWAGSVAVLDPVSGTYATITVGRSPHGIYLDPHGTASATVAQK